MIAIGIIVGEGRAVCIREGVLDLEFAGVVLVGRGGEFVVVVVECVTG